MPFNPTRRSLLTATALAALGARPAWAQPTTPISVGWYPGQLGASFKRGFFDTYPGARNVKIVESFDNARFTQMQANRKHPTLHVAVFTDVLLPLLVHSGLIAQLNPAQIPNLNQLDPHLARPAGAYAAPVIYGSWGIVYNARQVRKPLQSWGDLLREDLHGYVSAPNITYNSSIYTLDALAKLKGGSLQSPQPGMQVLHQIRTSGPGLWDQESIAVGWLKTGEIRATPYYSGNALAMMRDPDLADLRFVIPKEGAYCVPLSVTRVINPEGGDAPEAFINHMFSAQAQEACAQAGGGRPVNAQAKVSADITAAVPPADQMKTLDWNYFAQNRAAIVEQWNRIVNA